MSFFVPDAELDNGSSTLPSWFPSSPLFPFWLRTQGLQYTIMEVKPDAFERESARQREQHFSQLPSKYALDVSVRKDLVVRIQRLSHKHKVSLSLTDESSLSSLATALLDPSFLKPILQTCFLLRPTSDIHFVLEHIITHYILYWLQESVEYVYEKARALEIPIGSQQEEGGGGGGGEMQRILKDLVARSVADSFAEYISLVDLKRLIRTLFPRIYMLYEQTQAKADFFSFIQTKDYQDKHALKEFVEVWIDDLEQRHFKRKGGLVRVETRSLRSSSSSMSDEEGNTLQVLALPDGRVCGLPMASLCKTLFGQSSTPPKWKEFFKTYRGETQWVRPANNKTPPEMEQDYGVLLYDGVNRLVYRDAAFLPLLNSQRLEALLASLRDLLAARRPDAVFLNLYRTREMYNSVTERSYVQEFFSLADDQRFLSPDTTPLPATTHILLERALFQWVQTLHPADQRWSAFQPDDLMSEQLAYAAPLEEEKLIPLWDADMRDLSYISQHETPQTILPPAGVGGSGTDAVHYKRTALHEWMSFRSVFMTGVDAVLRQLLGVERNNVVDKFQKVYPNFPVQPPPPTSFEYESSLMILWERVLYLFDDVSLWILRSKSSEWTMRAGDPFTMMALGAYIVYVVFAAHTETVALHVGSLYKMCRDACQSAALPDGLSTEQVNAMHRNIGNYMAYRALRRSAFEWVLLIRTHYYLRAYSLQPRVDTQPETPTSRRVEALFYTDDLVQMRQRYLSPEYLDIRNQAPAPLLGLAILMWVYSDPALWSRSGLVQQLSQPQLASILAIVKVFFAGQQKDISTPKKSQ